MRNSRRAITVIGQGKDVERVKAKFKQEKYQKFVFKRYNCILTELCKCGLMQRIVWNCGNSIGGLLRTGSPPFIKQKI